MVVEFDSTQGVLFVLAGVGFLCGVAVYVTRYWRREFYLAGAGFAQIAAFFVLGGPVNGMAVASKTAEAVFAIAATYLYATDDAPAPATADGPD